MFEELKQRLNNRERARHDADEWASTASAEDFLAMRFPKFGIFPMPEYEKAFRERAIEIRAAIETGCQLPLSEVLKGQL